MKLIMRYSAAFVLVVGGLFFEGPWVGKLCVIGMGLLTCAYQPRKNGERDKRFKTNWINKLIFLLGLGCFATAFLIAYINN